MRNIWNIFRADWRRLTASVVAVVVLLGLCLVPCLYAWFNILSNWDPYGVASTSRIKVAVASEDQGYQVMGLELNIGELVLQGLESNDQMGWVFVDDADTALSGVESGEYYAALVVPEEFTGDFVSILTGDLRHPQIQYYENEKKNAIAPKITSKAKTAVQEQINTTVVGKAAEALTTVGTVCKAMGLDSQDLADGIMDKLTSARQETAQIQKVLVSLKDVMDGADSLLTAASVTIRDAQSSIDDAGGAVGGTVQVIGTGMTSANETNSDLLTVLDSADKLLADLDAMLRETGVAGIEETIQANMIARVDEGIVRLTAARDEAEASGDANTAQQLQAVIDGLVDLKEAIGTVSTGGALEPVLDTLAQVRQQLRAAAVNTNQQVNDYLQAAGAQAQASLRAIQQLLDAVARELAREKDLLGVRVTVTAGPTQESLDPVRYLTNHSSGKMGYAIAREAMLRGAEVTLISGPTALKPVPGVKLVPIVTAQDMLEAVQAALPETDILIKAAAVADYRPAAVSDQKLKKQDGELSIPLERTADILAWVSEHRHPGLFVCGFSMETENMLENSRKKLQKKHLDMIVANNLKTQGAGFGVETNVVTLITQDEIQELPLMGKDQVAGKLLDEIQRRR